MQNTSYGDPSVLSLADVPMPSYKADEVRIQVNYSSVNRTDCGFLRAKPAVTRLFTGITRPRYLALGCEFAGVIEAVGDAVTDYTVGDRVFGFDDAKFGGHAEYKVIKSTKMLAHVPDNVPLESAAIATEGGHYAQAFINKAPLKQGDHVFVHGATGSIGSAMVQLLVARGITVTASSTTEHVDTVKKLGPSAVIDWQTTPLEDHNGMYDHFFDAVGKSTFNVARKLIRPGGMYVSSELGPRGQNIWLSAINPIQRLFTKRNIVFPIPSTNKRLLEELTHRLETGEFKPLLDRSYDLADIRQAYDYVETGQKLGNVGIVVSKESSAN